MFIFLERSFLKKRGLFSFFRKNKQKLVFSSPEEDIFEIEFKSKSSYIGCLFQIPNTLKTLLMKATCERKTLEYTLSLANGLNEVHIDYSFAYGTIRYVVEPNCFFTLLENIFIDIRDDTLPKVKKHSVKVREIGNGIFERKAYSNMIYYSNIYDNIVNYVSSNANSDFFLPSGWERRILPNGREFFINHNKNYTQWNRPEDPGDIIDLLAKMNDYRRRTIPLNILAMFDIGKFVIPVYRNYIIQSTADLFLTTPRNKFLHDSHVIFSGEIGEDWGALFREFIYKASTELVNDERLKCIGCVYDIKTVDERKQENHPLLEYHLNHNIKRGEMNDQEHERIFDSRLIQSFTANGALNSQRIDDLFDRGIRLNPIINSIEKGYNILSDKDFYTYLGAFIGFALQKRLNIFMDLSLSFYENLLSRKFGIELIQDAQFQSGIDYIRKWDASQETIYDDYNDIPLTAETKDEYAERLIHDVLYLSKKTEYDLIRDGFYRIIDPCIHEYIKTCDLIYLLQGNEEVTFGMIVNSMCLLKCDLNTPEVKFLLEILKVGDENYLRNFLQFVTGSPSVPIGSIRSNRFKWYVEKTNTKDMYFRVTTCVNRLYIGTYDNVKIMKDILIFSMDNSEGFHKI